MDDFRVPALSLVILSLVMLLDWQRKQRGQGSLHGLELVENTDHDEPGAIGVRASSADEELAVVIDLGGDGEYEVTLNKSTVTSRSALKKHIVKACVAQLGRAMTPKQWRDKRAGSAPSMTVVLVFDNQIDPPSQLRLTDRTPFDRIMQATSVQAMPI